MAYVRPPTMAKRIHNTVHSDGQASRGQASSMAPSAKGRAKMVCSNFTSSPYSLMRDGFMSGSPGELR